MIALVPPLTPAPNCRLSNSSIAFDLVSLDRHFAMRRRNTSPTAIGLTPLFSSDKAASEAQQSDLEIKSEKKSPTTKIFKLCYRVQSKLRPIRCSALLRAEDVVKIS